MLMVEKNILEILILLYFHYTIGNGKSQNGINNYCTLNSLQTDSLIYEYIVVNTLYFYSQKENFIFIIFLTNLCPYILHFIFIWPKLFNNIYHGFNFS